VKRVFISYRRGPSTPYARQIYDELTERLGRARVFYDIDTLEPGTDFLEVIERHIDESGLMLVIMDSEWATVAHPSGDLRLDDEDDPVRMEVSRALERKLKVIPVLVGGAKMPKASALPTPLKSLVRRQAHELTDSHWGYDIDELVKRVASSLGVRRVKPARRRGVALKDRRRSFVKGAVATGLLSNVGRVVGYFQTHTVPAVAASTIVVAGAGAGVYKAVDVSKNSQKNGGADVAEARSNPCPPGFTANEGDPSTTVISCESAQNAVCFDRETLQETPCGIETTPATAPSAAGGPPTRFQTPTGRIGCAISQEFVNCSITTADWTPPGEPSCPPKAGRFIAFSGQVPQFQCGNPEPPVGEVLSYGESLERGTFTCKSASSGLTCESGSHGFFISREEQATH
jgi:TIR domain